VTGYDYVLAGVPTAGCVVAARLSQNRVLLLEGGGSGRASAIRAPNAWPGNLGSPAEWERLGRTWGIGLGARRRTAVFAARRGRCRAWSGAAEMAWAQIRGSGVAVCAVAVGGAGVGGGKSCRG